MNEAIAAIGGILLLIVFCTIYYAILNWLSEILSRAFIKLYLWLNEVVANKISNLSEDEKARWKDQLNSHDEGVK